MQDHPDEVDFDLNCEFDVCFEVAATGEIIKLPGSSPVAGTQGTWLLTVRNYHGDLQVGPRSSSHASIASSPSNFSWTTRSVAIMPA